MVEETPKLLLDSSFIISLFYGDKDSVDKATSILPALITVDHLYINNYILSEILTVLSQRIGKKKTKASLETIQNNRIELINVPRNVEGEAYDEFLAIEKKDISFADVVSVLHAQEKAIDAILTLDKHYLYLQKRYGIKMFCL